MKGRENKRGMRGRVEGRIFIEEKAEVPMYYAVGTGTLESGFGGTEGRDGGGLGLG